MRIGTYMNVQQIYGTKKATRTSSTSKVSKRDALELSSIGKDIQIAKTAVNDAPDVREDVVAPIRSQIQNGTYEVSEESFAEKLMAKFNQQV